MRWWLRLSSVHGRLRTVNSKQHNQPVVLTTSGAQLSHRASLLMPEHLPGPCALQHLSAQEADPEEPHVCAGGRLHAAQAVKQLSVLQADP